MNPQNVLSLSRSGGNPISVKLGYQVIRIYAKYQESVMINICIPILILNGRAPTGHCVRLIRIAFV